MSGVSGSPAFVLAHRVLRVRPAWPFETVYDLALLAAVHGGGPVACGGGQRAPFTKARGSRLVRAGVAELRADLRWSEDARVRLNISSDVLGVLGVLPTTVVHETRAVSARVSWSLLLSQGGADLLHEAVTAG